MEDMRHILITIFFVLLIMAVLGAVFYMIKQPAAGAQVVSQVSYEYKN